MAPSSPRRRPLALDQVDRAIIEALARDGRASNRALAGEVGLTEATVATRIRNLQDHRILGVSAVFDWEAAGYRWDVRVLVEVEGRPAPEVAEALARLPAVRWVMLVFGPVDIVVHAQFADREAVAAWLTDGLASVDGARRVTAEVNLETLKYEVNLARVPVQATPLEFPAPVVDLDDVDHRIIGALAADGRQSNRQIGRQLAVSEGTVRARLGRLERSGLLRICGQSDPYLTGRVGAWAYVGIDVAGRDVAEVGASLAAMAEVLVLTVTTGRHHLVAFVVAPSRSVLVDVVLRRMRAVDGVRRTETIEVIRSVRLDYQWARLL